MLYKFLFKYFILVLTLQSKLSSKAVLTIKPRNTVGLVGQQVILECAVNSLINTVDWFYRSTSRSAIHLTRNHEKKRMSVVNKVEVIFNDKDRNYITYNLKILNLTVEDAGFYSCYVTLSFKNKKRQGASASLSIFRLDSCLSYFNNIILSHTCNLQITGATRYYYLWQCKQPGEGTLAVRKQKGKNLGKLPMDIFYLIVSHKANYTNFDSLSTCSLRIKPRKTLAKDIINNDQRQPHFDTYVFFISTIGSTTLQEEVCIRDKNGYLPLHTIVRYTFSYLNFHNLSLEDYNKFSSKRNYSCLINDVSLGRAIFTTNPPKVFDMYGSMSCEDKGVSKCYTNFTKFINKNYFFVDVQFDEYDLLCSRFENAGVCIEYFQPCRITPTMKGIIDSYEFLCSTDYKSFYQIPVNPFDFNTCREHYPQAMANIYNRAGSFYKSGFSSDAFNHMLVDSFCERLTISSTLFCVEHILASNTNLELARWYLKFVSHLKQFRIFEYFPHNQVYYNTSRFFRSCADFTKDVSRIECLRVDKCFSPLSLLLETINSGFVVITDLAMFSRKVCVIKKKDFLSCVEGLLPYCNITTYNLYRALTPLKKALCTDLKKAYERHHNCFIRLHESVFIAPKCSWWNLYEKLYTHSGSMQDFASRVCRMGKLHFECIEKLVSPRCGPEAAYLQKHLLKLLLAYTFDQLFCADTYNVAWKNLQINHVISASVIKSLSALNVLLMLLLHQVSIEVIM